VIAYIVYSVNFTSYQDIVITPLNHKWYMKKILKYIIEMSRVTIIGESLVIDFKVIATIVDRFINRISP